MDNLIGHFMRPASGLTHGRRPKPLLPEARAAVQLCVGPRIRQEELKNFPRRPPIVFMPLREAAVRDGSAIRERAELIQDISSSLMVATPIIPTTELSPVQVDCKTVAMPWNIISKKAGPCER